MPTMKVRFPGGRYHATPWGHHVNEGLIEWPPSPWRLLRALIARGFSSQGWTEIPSLAQQLVNKLAGALPSYRLPEASVAHSRHYMPYLEGAKQKTTLVFDTWANVGDGELVIHWPCELTHEETELLSRLVSSLGYLGRSESWVEGDLLAADVADFNAEPCRDGERRGFGWEQVSLMAAIPPNEYQAWQSAQVRNAQSEYEGKRRTAALQKKIDKAVEPFPADLPACLVKDTEWWKGQGWSQPPGSKRILYWRRSDALQVGPPQRPKPPHYNTVTTMLLSLTTPSGNRSALPSVTRTLPQAELFHRAIVGRVGQGRRVCCPELTGRDERGEPLQVHHKHAHTLPMDLDGDGRIDHIIIYASMGLRGIAQQAIRTLRRTWTKGGVGDLQIAVAGSGDLATLRSLPMPYGRRIGEVLGPTGGSRIWRSVTPFVFPRFLKARGKNTMLGQLNAELASRRLPELVDVSIDSVLTRELRHYIRRRNHGGNSAPVDEGYGLQVTFAEPLSGPLMLGYAAHYGLGLFHAVDGAAS